MRLNPYLSFNGNCAEALELYQHCLGAKVDRLMKWGESPMAEQIAADWRDKVIHAQLTIGNDVIMAADAPAGQYTTPGGFSVTVNVDDPAEAERIFKTLADKGSVRMELQETFFAQKFGALVDRFGIPWMVNCENPA